eukprot:364999-Chlamydomonas_euryale.AAC.10
MCSQTFELLPCVCLPTWPRQLEDVGMQGLADADSAQLMCTDLRSVRRRLHDVLSRNRTLRAAFEEGLLAALRSPPLLRKLLLPVRPVGEAAIGGGGSGGGSGDSLLRMALGLPLLQPALTAALLELLPEHSGGGDDEGHDGGGSGGSSTAGLIVAQMRWLEVVARPGDLVAKLLEVLPACGRNVQSQLVGVLPEVAGDEEQAAVVDALEELLGGDVSLVAPVLDALSAMQLQQQGPPGRALLARCVEAMARRLGAVEGGALAAAVAMFCRMMPCPPHNAGATCRVFSLYWRAHSQADDLPAVLRFVLTLCGKSDARRVYRYVRDALHFSNSADPRLPLPDAKQKGRRGGGASMEERTLAELVEGLQVWMHRCGCRCDSFRGRRTANTLCNCAGCDGQP